MKLIGCNVNELLLTGLTTPGSVRRDAEGVPTAVRIFAPGKVTLTVDGQQVTGLVTAADIQAFADYQTSKGMLIPVDCEHLLARLASMLGIEESELVDAAPILGEKAAAGFAQLKVEAGELWAHFTKWTGRARELFLADSDGMYGYFSPTIRGLITAPLRMTSITLTNQPAINDQDMLAASDRAGAAVHAATITHIDNTTINHTGGRDMKALTALAQALGIDIATLTGETPNFEPLAAAIRGVLQKQKDFLGSIADAIGCSGETTFDQAQGLILAMSERVKADATQLSDMQNRMGILEGSERDRYIATLQSEGKLTDAMLPWARKQNMIALRDYAATAPRIVPASRMILVDGGAQPLGDTVTLSDRSAEIAKECGYDPAQVAKANGLKVTAVAVVAMLLGLSSLFAPMAQATAATAARNTLERDGSYYSVIQGSNTIYAGTMVAVDGNGVAVPASDATGLSVIGRAEETSANIGADYSATKAILVKPGIYRWVNDGSFDDSNIGDLAFVEDDVSVIDAASVTYKIIAGVIMDVDSSGVWVDTRDIGSQGAGTLTTLTASGAVTLQSTLGVTGAITGSSTLDVDSVTVDAAAGIDTQAAGTLKVGEATATKVEVADTGVSTDVEGPLVAKEDIKSDEIDAETATALLIGKATATGVTIGATDADTTIAGDLIVNGLDIDSGAGAMTVGKAAATSLALGAADITTTVPGPLVASLALWLGTNGYFQVSAGALEFVGHNGFTNAVDADITQ